LTIPNLAIGDTEWTNVKAILGPATVVSIGGSPPLPPADAIFAAPPPAPSAVDTFTEGTRILAIPVLTIGEATFRNLLVRLGSVTVTGIGDQGPYFQLPPSPYP